MSKILVIAVTIIALLHAAVPVLESWELPGSNVVSASATAAQELE